MAGWLVCVLFFTLWDVALMNPKCLSTPRLPPQTGSLTIPAPGRRALSTCPALPASLGGSVPFPPPFALSPAIAILFLNLSRQSLSPVPASFIVSRSHASSGFPPSCSRPGLGLPAPLPPPRLRLRLPRSAAAGPLLPALRLPGPSWSCRDLWARLHWLQGAVTPQQGPLLVGPEARSDYKRRGPRRRGAGGSRRAAT